MKIALFQKILRIWIALLIATFALAACNGEGGDGGSDEAGIESSVGAGGEEEGQSQEESDEDEESEEEDGD